MAMDSVQLNQQQLHALHEALLHYAAHLSQPTETAEDRSAQRQAVSELLQHVQKHTSLGTKRYKMVNGQWVPCHK